MRRPSSTQPGYRTRQGECPARRGKGEGNDRVPALNIDQSPGVNTWRGLGGK